MTDTSSDKRQNSRARVSISCAFGTTEDTPRSGAVTSLSVKGCFVKTRAWADRGTEMYIKIWLPQRNWLTLRAAVLYHLDKIGFGLSFEGVTPDAEEAIRVLIEDAKRTGGQPREDGGDEGPEEPPA